MTVTKLMILLGLMASCTALVPCARLWLGMPEAGFFNQRSKPRGTGLTVSIAKEAAASLLWWAIGHNMLQGVSFIFSHSSGRGDYRCISGGYFLPGPIACGWLATFPLLSWNSELCIRRCWFFSPHDRKKVVLIKTDSNSVIFLSWKEVISGLMYRSSNAPRVSTDVQHHLSGDSLGEGYSTQGLMS